jgi:hypothetical protein
MNKNGSADGKERATPNFQTCAPPPRVVLSSSRYSTLAREIHRYLFRIKYASIIACLYNRRSLRSTIMLRMYMSLKQLHRMITFFSKKNSCSRWNNLGRYTICDIPNIHIPPVPTLF